MSYDILGQKLIATTNIEGIMRVITTDITTSIRLAVPAIKDNVRSLLLRKVPVRSGRLLDNMLEFLDVTLYGNVLNVSSKIPAGYPVIIEGPAHLGEEGYGPKYSPRNNIPNRRKIRDTDAGAIYALNDPEAEPDYANILGRYVYPIVQNIVGRLFKSYTIIIGAGKVPKTASQAGQMDVDWIEQEQLFSVGHYEIAGGRGYYTSYLSAIESYNEYGQLLSTYDPFDNKIRYSDGTVQDLDVEIYKSMPSDNIANIVAKATKDYIGATTNMGATR
jgi:hypothetical protein